MSRVGVVMRREFLSTIRRRSYLIISFGMPFFAACYFALVALLPAWFMARGGLGDKPIGLVDRAGVVRWEEAAAAPAEGAGRERAPGAAGSRVGPGGHDTGVGDPAGRDAAVTGAGADDDTDDPLAALAGRLDPADPRLRAGRELLEQATAPAHFLAYEDREAALQALAAGDIDRFYLIPEGYLADGAVESYQSEEASVGFGRSRGNRSLERLLQRSLTAGRLPEEVRARLRRPVDEEASRSFLRDRDGRLEPFDAGKRIARMAIPGAFGVLLLMSLMTSAGYLLQGISEEKENRVIEVILSSVPPDHLLFGKLLGLGAAGLLQLAIWVLVASFATGLVAAAALAALDARLFVYCLVFFVLGFLMIGSLMTGTGALGSSPRESQQLAAVWSMATVLPPAVTWMVLMDEPNGWIARGLGWFPLTAPITMMIRLATGRVPLWDALLSMALLAAGVYLAVRAAAALFRLGLLMYGKRPTLFEILRQLRRL